MGKRSKNRQNRSARDPAKRIKLSQEYQDLIDPCEQYDGNDSNFDIQVQQQDEIEAKVDIIVKDIGNNCHRSLTIWGKGLGIEKTISVVEQLKRNYLKGDTRYSQETSIKTGEDNEPHLQVILTLLDINSETTPTM